MRQQSSGSGKGSARALLSQTPLQYWDRFALARSRGLVLPRPPDQVERAVYAVLSGDPQLRHCDIRVRFKEGVLVMSGKVGCASLRKRAEDCLDEIFEVQLIRNEIEVRARAA